MAEINVQKLAELVGGKLSGDPARIVRGFAPVESAREDEASFLANKRYEKHMTSTKAAAVFVAKDYDAPTADGCALIRCDDPYFAFRQAMVEVYGFRKPEFTGIDSRANIDPSAKLGQGVNVGAFATIAPGCTIGAGTTIYPSAYIGPNCRLGDGCIIYPNVTIYEGTIIGHRVTIHAGSSIGHDGFGYATYKGKHEKIPTPGWVEIQDDVELGACCTIDRATLGPTVIGAGTKFSNLIAIGHGTKMGKGCLMVAQSGLAGSVNVGNYCVFAGQVGVVGHINIGDGVRVGAQSGVVNDVPPGKELLGSPAIDLADARKNYIVALQLPEMRKEMRAMARELEKLKSQVEGKKDSRE